MSVSRRSVWAFLILAVVLSWPLWLVSGVLPRAGTGAYDARWLIAQVGVMGPSLAALLVSGSMNRAMRRNSLRLLPVVLGPLLIPGLLVASAAPARVSLIPPVPGVAAVTVTALVVLALWPLRRGLLAPATGTPQARPATGDVVFSLTLLPALFLVSWALVNAGSGRFEIAHLGAGPFDSAWILLVCFAHNLLLGGSLGEELGWRGFLLPALLQRMSPFGASMVVAVVTGVWHLPIDLYAGFGVTGVAAVLARIIFLVPLSILFTWQYLRSKGSLLIAVFFHPSVNVMGDLGLSGYEGTAVVFGVVAGVVALGLGAANPALRGDESGG